MLQPHAPRMVKSRTRLFPVSQLFILHLATAAIILDLATAAIVLHLVRANNLWIVYK